MFSQEKFILNVHNGIIHYWHDLSKEGTSFSQHLIVGFLFQFVKISMRSKAELVMIEDNSILKESFVTFDNCHYRRNFVFLQDNTVIDIAKITKEQFECKHMEWLANSTDCNCIAYLWGILSRFVYEQGRQSGNWNINEIPLETLENLLYSMSNKFIQILQSILEF